mmetsp:Transcript_36507/g.60113  ORF Transcript_36507/g.60113 Transcript_36507/m.60113 type:complete len:110 (+) Transcript_36507:1-330(+)
MFLMKFDNLENTSTTISPMHTTPRTRDKFIARSTTTTSIALVMAELTCPNITQTTTTTTAAANTYYDDEDYGPSSQLPGSHWQTMASQVHQVTVSISVPVASLLFTHLL